MDALRRTGLLDTRPDERFDRITRMAASHLDAPVAMLNLVDERRRWTKSAVGLPHGIEVDRANSICTHVIDAGAPVVVPDAAHDPRFRDHPLTSGVAGLACYLGVPVHDTTGHVIGSLCVADSAPRELGDRDVEVLSDLACWVEAEIERDRLAALTLDERALRDRLGSVTASMGEAVLVLDPEGTITDANAAATTMTGLPQDRLVGMPVAAILGEGDVDAPSRWLGDCREGSAPVREEIEVRSVDGRVLPVELTITHSAEEDALVLVGRDVSERRRHLLAVEILRHRYEGILDVAADAIVRLDAGGIVDYANPAAERLLGMPSRGLWGVDLHDRFHATRPDGSPYPWTECPTHHTLRRAEGQQSVDETFMRADGRPVLVEFSSSPVITDDEVTGAVLVLRDNAARREMERLKSELVSTVSHELRTPLTSVKGALSLVCGGVLGEIEDEIANVLGAAHLSTDRLIRLVNELLDLGRLDAGALELDRRPATLDQLVGYAMDAVETLAVEAGVSVEVDVPASQVVVDVDRIVQAVTNLLGNAVRFSPRGATVTVTGRVRDGSVVLDVRDQGRGVPQEARERIFERFGQADASDARERSGTGLGLPIARELVERHGGRLWLGDAEVGSVFHLELPLPVEVVA